MNLKRGATFTRCKRVSQDVVLLQFGRNAVDFTRIRVGDLVWRSLDPALPRRLKRFTEATSPVYTRPVSFAVTAHTRGTIATHGADREGSQRQGHGDRPTRSSAAPSPG